MERYQKQSLGSPSRSTLNTALKTTIAQLIKQPHLPHAPQTIETLGQFLACSQAHTDSSTFNLAVRRQFSFETRAETGALCTGYYLPRIKGSLSPSSYAPYPIFARPDTPQVTRTQIRSGILAGKGFEIAWAHDPIELYFMHIQGSGVLELEDGSTRLLAFDGSNDFPYTSIGATLVKDRLFSADLVSAQAVEQYLRSQSANLDSILERNQRYIYFKEASEGPCGTLGAGLEEFCSAALDWQVYPPGSICHIEGAFPVVDSDGQTHGLEHQQRFLLNHDSGAAISGAGRIDVYCGSGNWSRQFAGQLKHRATLQLLKSIASP